LRKERGTSAKSATTRLFGSRLVLAIPDTFMNESGLALARLTRHYRTELGRVMIVHDELDLPLGVVRVKRGGGTAGHNGLKSVQSHVHSLDFIRIRIGIGKPPGRMSGADYVLARFGARDSETVSVAIERAADAVELIVERGVDAAMSEVNAR